MARAPASCRPDSTRSLRWWRRLPKKESLGCRPSCSTWASARPSSIRPVAASAIAMTVRSTCAWIPAGPCQPVTWSTPGRNGTSSVSSVTMAKARFARRIARAIIAARPVQSTGRLADVVRNAIPAAARRTGGHPARRTFQAVRIAVNEELLVLPGAVDAALAALGSGWPLRRHLVPLGRGPHRQGSLSPGGNRRLPVPARPAVRLRGRPHRPFTYPSGTSAERSGGGVQPSVGKRPVARRRAAGRGAGRPDIMTDVLAGGRTAPVRRHQTERRRGQARSLARAPESHPTIRPGARPSAARAAAAARLVGGSDVAASTVPATACLVAGASMSDRAATTAGLVAGASNSDRAASAAGLVAGASTSDRAPLAWSPTPRRPIAPPLAWSPARRRPMAPPPPWRPTTPIPSLMGTNAPGRCGSSSRSSSGRRSDGAEPGPCCSPPARWRWWWHLGWCTSTWCWPNVSSPSTGWTPTCRTSEQRTNGCGCRWRSWDPRNTSSRLRSANSACANRRPSTI